jgi:hypothetical protein
MSDNSDASLLGMWKAGWLVLWRLCFIGIGFYGVTVFFRYGLDTLTFYIPVSDVMRWVVWSLVLLIGFPFLAYWAGRWYETKR